MKKVLFVIDTYSGAYNINVNGVAKNFPNVDVYNVAARDLPKYGLTDYDEIFVLAWWLPQVASLMNEWLKAFDNLPLTAIVGGHQHIRSNKASMLFSYRKVYAVSNRLVQELASYGVESEFIAWFYDDSVFYPAENRDASIFTVGWVGNGSRECKRYELFKGLYKRLKDEKWFAPLVSIATPTTNLEGHASLKFDRQQDEMGDFYRSLDCFVVTSSHEGQPKTAIEAALCGVPIIGSDVGVCRELGAFVIEEPLSVESLVVMIHRLRERPEWCKMMGEATYFAAKSVWARENVLNMWRKVLDI